MDSVRIYFKIKDLSQWKKIFYEDVDSGLLEGAGVTKFDFQQLVETGEPSLYFELKDAKKFEEFMKSDNARKRMSEAGVVGTPRLEFMKRIDERKIGGEKAA